MKTILYKVTFLTWWHCGSGQAAGPDVDELTMKDADGLPFIPGRTMKGLLRDACRLLEDYSFEGMNMERINAVFGYYNEKKDNEYPKKGLAFFSDMVLPVNDRNKITADKDLIRSLYSSIAATAIGEDGIAKDHSLDYVRDDMGNLIISRPASKGCEGFAPIALQGHIDMVCEKDASNPIDMEKQAISLMTDGEWIWADRTTLGGDDGIAVAIMLALLVDETITCPPLECIFTVDEEVGLLGADKMNLTGLRSRRMINLDSENEGLITASCAGGAEVGLTYKAKRRDKKGEVLTLSVKGLRGGHSGECINCGRANADILLARLLYRLEKVGKYCIIGINGGLRDNAIPREAKAEIIFTGNFKHREVKEAVQSFADDIAREYSVTDPDIHIHAEWANKGKIITRIAFGRKDSRRLVRFLMAIPNGLIETSALYKDVPQTSLNLGILKTMAEGFHMVSMVRSSINSQKQMLLDRIACIADEFGISMAVEGVYPAWELIEQSDFRDLAADVYQQLTGKKAEVCVIHGGLECGLLAAKVPGLDCISIGPDMEGVHTPSERLNIPSSKRTYDYIKSILEVCTKQ